MKLHFACSPSRIHINVLKKAQVKNVLFSYAFIKNPFSLKQILGDFIPECIILDSGAFSVWSNGGKINIDKYADFALRFRDLIHPAIDLRVVNLDVLPGEWGQVPSKEIIAESAEQGWQNMLYLESKGLKIIHIFHQHEDFAILDKLRAHSDYIGISPANDVSMKEKIAWLKKVFSITKDTVKTHGFAVTSHKQVFGYPFYSVDSSSWVAPARFGRIPILDERYEVKTFPYKKKEDVEKFWKYISHIGIEKIANPTWEDRVLISIRTYQKLEMIATDLWKRRGVVWDVDN